MSFVSTSQFTDVRAFETLSMAGGVVIKNRLNWTLCGLRRRKLLEQKAVTEEKAFAFFGRKLGEMNCK